MKGEEMQEVSAQGKHGAQRCAIQFSELAQIQFLNLPFELTGKEGTRRNAGGYTIQCSRAQAESTALPELGNERQFSESS